MSMIKQEERKRNQECLGFFCHEKLKQENGPIGKEADIRSVLENSYHESTEKVPRKSENQVPTNSQSDRTVISELWIIHAF